MTRINVEPPQEALRACGDDLDSGLDELEAKPPPFAPTHYKSRIFYVTPRGHDAPTHVIKLDDASEYDPEGERDALLFAGKLLAEAGDRAQHLRVVQPIAWSATPKFLVTRYQAGGLCQSSFDAAVLRKPNADVAAEARRQARLIGRWLSVFRETGLRDDGGQKSATLIDEITSLARNAASALGKQRALTALVACLEGYLTQFDDRDRRELATSHPARGDARPKNFLAAPDGGLYAFDMEGFGYGALHQDLACMHHSLEYDGFRTPAAHSRATLLWQEVLGECLVPERSAGLALIGYLRFLLGRLQLTARQGPGIGWRKRARNAIWTRNRLRWLSGLTGDLAADACYFRARI